MSWITEKPITHRGLYDNINFPENSLAAFELAVKSGYPIEFDLQFLKDEKIAVFHDSNLFRMTGVNGSVRKKNSIELKKLNLLETNQTIPLLEEMLELVNGKVPLLVEIKSNNIPGKFESEVLNTLSNYSGEYAIESFNPLTVLWFKQNAEQIKRGILSRSLFRANMYAKIIKPHFLAVDINKIRTSGKVNKKFPLIGYTATSFNEFNEAKKVFDNVIFEGFQP